MIALVVITHGRFGEELLRTAQDIVGKQDNVAVFAVTSDTGLDNVRRFVTETLEQFRSSNGVLFLVDMLGGTPCNAALLGTKDSAAEVVTGVNLYMLISAFTHRTHLDLRALAVKATEDGKRAIGLPKDLLLKKSSS